MRTRIKLPGLLLCAAALGGLAACGAGEKELNLIEEEFSAYRATHPGYLEYQIAGHLQPYRRILVNPEGGAFFDAPPSDGRYPEGTVFVKENFTETPTEGDEADFLTVMIKQSDHPEAVAGWVWLTRDGDGKESIVSGKFCISCHQAANADHQYGAGNPENEFRDYIFYPPFQKDRL